MTTAKQLSIHLQHLRTHGQARIYPSNSATGFFHEPTPDHSQKGCVRIHPMRDGDSSQMQKASYRIASSRYQQRVPQNQ